MIQNFICIFCKQQRKNHNSWRNHQRTCILNPQRKLSKGRLGKKGHPNLSNGHIKAKKENRIFIMSDKAKDALHKASKNRTAEWHERNGKKISATIRKKVEEGTWHTSLAKKMHINYKNIDLHGSWELKYAMYLDKFNIKWIRNKNTFDYFFDGKNRKYTPDFYLPDTDEYVEIKGYKTKKDDAKWSQFPVHQKLKILTLKELKQLNILV